MVLGPPHKAKHVPACATTTGVPTLTIAPNPLVETGQSEVHAVVEFEDLTAADQKVDINSSQLSAACGGTITFSDLQGVTATTPPNSKITPATTTNFVSLGSTMRATPLPSCPVPTAPPELTSSTPLSRSAVRHRPRHIEGEPARHDEGGSHGCSGDRGGDR